MKMAGGGLNISLCLSQGCNYTIKKKSPEENKLRPSFFLSYTSALTLRNLPPLSVEVVLNRSGRDIFVQK